jgi:hypothetical protein
VRLHPAAGEVARHPTRAAADVPDPHPAATRGQQVAEQTKDGALLRHPIDRSGQPLGVELRERVMRSSKFVGLFVPRGTLAASAGIAIPGERPAR